jgi:glycosyltransferase involved in cell wall biosynthesis
MVAHAKSKSQPRVAIVSDPMCQAGGAERVVEALSEAFPDAPIFSILYSPAHGPRSIQHRVVQSWLHRLPGATSYARALFPLYPSAIESFDLAEYDVLVSSHHTLVKGLLRNSNQTHICYCHTPMRALWELPHEEVTRAPAIVRPLIRAMLLALRSWDFTTAARVDHFVANSRLTSDRIRMHYRRDSIVVHPPIEIDRFVPGNVEVGDYYLVAARNVPYKRIDLAIEACERLARRLIVVGEGTDRLARDSRCVTFLGKVSEEKLRGLLQGTRALLFPQKEDFGMALLEANACGRPVIAYGAGGALETVLDGRTGVLFPEQSVEGMMAAIESFERREFDPAEIREHAELYSKKRFIATMQTLVYEAFHNSTESRFPEISPVRLTEVGH